jgi:YbbR domain-containing protein
MAWHPFRNFWLKVAALALGTLLWFTVSGQEVERTVRAPIEYVNVPAPLAITGDQIDSVSVHLRGTDMDIGRIAAGDVHVTIDLAGTHAVTKGTFPLRTDQITVPFGIEVLRVDPPEVTLTLESSGARVVPVLPDIAGVPAVGFVKGAVTVEPADVEVLGPDSQLRRLDHATTARVSIAGAASTVTQSVSIMVPDATLRLREPRLAKVTVAVVSVRNGGK